MKKKKVKQESLNNSLGLRGGVSSQSLDLAGRPIRTSENTKVKQAPTPKTPENTKVKQAPTSAKFISGIDLKKENEDNLIVKSGNKNIGVLYINEGKIVFDVDSLEEKLAKKLTGYVKGEPVLLKTEKVDIGQNSLKLTFNDYITSIEITSDNIKITTKDSEEINKPKKDMSLVLPKKTFEFAQKKAIDLDFPQFLYDDIKDITNKNQKLPGVELKPFLVYEDKIAKRPPISIEIINLEDRSYLVNTDGLSRLIAGSTNPAILNGVKENEFLEILDFDKKGEKLTLEVKVGKSTQKIEANEVNTKTLKELKQYIQIPSQETEEAVEEEIESEFAQIMVNPSIADLGGALGGTFALPVYEQNGGSRTRIGEKQNQYSEAENIFEYITSKNKKLMKVFIRKLSDGQIQKTLELDNSDNKFDAFKKIVEKDSSVGYVDGGKIYVNIEDITYNPTSEITVSLKKDIEDEGTKYRSIDVLSNSVILSGKGKRKPIYAAEDNEIINQVLPSNFFELFVSNIIKGKALPAQQLEALIQLSKEGRKLPEGVLKASEYEIYNKKLNVLLLQDYDSSGKPIKKLFAQMGTEVMQIDTIYRIPDQKTARDSKDSINLLFGATINKSADDMGEFKKIHRIEGINENTEEFKRFQAEILMNNERAKDDDARIDFKYEEDFTKDENKLISPTKRIVRGKIIVNQKIGEEKNLQESPGSLEPACPLVEPPRRRASFGRPRRRRGGWLKYLLKGLAFAACAVVGILGLLTPMGIVQALTLLVLAGGIGTSIFNDAREDMFRRLKDESEENSEAIEKESAAEKAKDKELEEIKAQMEEMKAELEKAKTELETAKTEMEAKNKAQMEKLEAEKLETEAKLKEAEESKLAQEGEIKILTAIVNGALGAGSASKTKSTGAPAPTATTATPTQTT